MEQPEVCYFCGKSDSEARIVSWFVQNPWRDQEEDL